MEFILLESMAAEVEAVKKGTCDVAFVNSGFGYTAMKDPAVVVAFLVPMILTLACLFAVVGLTGSEMTGCWATLLVLAIYYLGVWLMRDRLERRAEFTLERM